MPDLVRIGPIAQNASGVGARGYVVRRTGTIVIVEYGKIEVVGSGRSRFNWLRKPQLIRYARKTIASARTLARELVRDQLRPGSKGGYSRLPTGTRIRHRRTR